VLPSVFGALPTTVIKTAEQTSKTKAMSTKKVTFTNSKGQKLSARLELPDDTQPHNFALFAHCFTCNKDLTAVRNIARALKNEGIGVLRFDFTGLGQSEGDFASTNFSSNINDLIEAANFLEENYAAPTLIIGHSLGGAAALFAANCLPSIQAVATIGAPSSPDHVQHLFEAGIDAIEEEGQADVNIGGRSFKIEKQFVDDLKGQNMKEMLSNMRKSLLIIHSPQDTIVGIENAKEIYINAHHPKSYISLDGANHLLSNTKDSTYVGSVIAGWADRYLEKPEVSAPNSKHQVAVRIGNSGFTSEVSAGRHYLVADEPESFGGNNYGPSPYDFVSIGLGACTAMTMRMYAERKKWPLESATVHVDYGKEHAKDCDDLEGTGKGKKIDTFKRTIQLEGDLDDAQRKRLIEIADKCPVHRTLHAQSEIKTTLIASEN